MLSATGWGALTGGGVLIGVGYRLGYPEAVVLGSAGVLAALVAVAWTVRRPGLTAQRAIMPRKVTRGDLAEGVLTLTNTGPRALRGLRATDLCDGLVLPVAVPPLRSGATHQVRYVLPTGRRGRIPVGPLCLDRTDPLGLSRRTGVHSGRSVLVVRPRVCLLPVLPSGRAHHVEGPTSDTADNGSLTFHALRAYVLGDDLRRVHWRSTARTGKLMVRHMVDVSLPHTTVVLDTRRSAYHDADDFELAVDSAASLAHAATRSNFPVHLVSEQGPLLSTDGSGNDSETVLDRLALVQPSPHASASSAFEALERSRDGGSLTVVTGVGDTTGLSAVGRVTNLFDRVVLLRVGADKPEREEHRLAVDVPQLRITSLDGLLASWRWEAVR